MAASLITQGSTLLCLHGGRAQATQVSSRVKVGGEAVVLATPLVLEGCPNPAPPVQSGPCQTASWLTLSLRVRVEGQAIPLSDAYALCQPALVGLSIVTQTRVRGS